MRVGLNAMDRANDRLMSNRKVVSVERILEAQIAGIMPVTALCLSEGGGAPAKIPFFQGEAGDHAVGFELTPCRRARAATRGFWNIR